jgi:hypothetical protein
MTVQSVSYAERLVAAKQHLAPSPVSARSRADEIAADRAWPSLVADSRRPSLAWSSTAAVPEADEASLVKLAISWTG